MKSGLIDRADLRALALLVAGALVPASVWASELRVGVASVDITPPIGSRMYGYSARGTNVSTGVHDPLYAKAIVLDDGKTRVAVATLDLGTVTEENTTNIRAIVKEKTGIENVLCVASHTHSSPFPSPDFPSAEDPWVRDAERKIAGAIVEAAGRTVPARLGIGWGEVAEGHNRRRVREDGTVEMLWENRERVPTNPVDYQLAVIRVEGLDGRPLATLVNFACHPVVLGPENLLISADYPGVLARLLEAETGGQAMFLQGAPGDINPFWDKTPPDEGAFEQTEKMGSALAAEAIRVYREITDLSSDRRLSFHTEIIPLAHRDDVERKDLVFDAEINTVLIGGDLAVATFPGEFFVEHGLALKARSRIENTLFVGYCNRRLRYFPTIRATTEGGYGAAYYGSSSATQVEVGAGERLVNRALVNLYYQAEMIAP
jgi:neutral ceramidase